MDGQGVHKWRVGDSRVAAIVGTRLGEVSFSTASKLDMWMRGVKFRSELVGPDGITVLPWGEVPGWVGWVPPKCSRTSPELRQQLILEHAQRLALAEGWQRMEDWHSRLLVGQHERGLGVGAWVIGNHTGSPCIGKIMAWNWTRNRSWS